MGVVEGRTWLEMLSPPECEGLLRGEEVGRVAVVVDGHPEIFPVNYVVGDERRIYFRCDKGTKLHALSEAETIGFEIDGIDEEHHVGWSVLVVGPASHVRDPVELSRVRQLRLQPWAAGEKANFVGIAPVKITGRRIRRPATGA